MAETKKSRESVEPPGEAEKDAISGLIEIMVLRVFGELRERVRVQIEAAISHDLREKNGSEKSEVKSQNSFEKMWVNLKNVIGEILSPVKDQDRISEQLAQTLALKGNESLLEILKDFVTLLKSEGVQAAVAAGRLTFGFLKPDLQCQCLKNPKSGCDGNEVENWGEIMSVILKKIESRGLKLVGYQPFSLTKEGIAEFYAHLPVTLKEKGLNENSINKIINDVQESMILGALETLFVYDEGGDTVRKFREEVAMVIRDSCGEDKTKNAIHSSEFAKDVEREINFFIKRFEQLISKAEKIKRKK